MFAPHFQVAIGFSTNESSLFLGDGDESVGFDSEGAGFRRDTWPLRMKDIYIYIFVAKNMGE